MASSSQPSSSNSSACVPTRGSTYDIFLSFRGEDTRNNFVDHLYADLDRKGIYTFKDDQMLGGGKAISESLLKAIKESKFAVVVFSKDYVNSSWCLEELSEIMECHRRCGLKVLPVFYHVDPSDVRKQKGNFTFALQWRIQDFLLWVCKCIPCLNCRSAPDEENNKVNKWKEALTAAASFSGYHILPDNGGETATINKIVQHILDDMRPRGREANLIGIESQMDRLNSLLSIEATDEVRVIGILGMGGIGKTTIARALFKRIAYRFEGSSFVSNVRENSLSKRDICLLQEKILKDILAARHEFAIQDPEYGADMIQERFCNKKVLLVLDDVDNGMQLEFLGAAHAHDWFGRGSRIMITTRDEHTLSNAKFLRYKPPLLRIDQALELFSRHAFKNNSPPDEFKKLSDRAVLHTGGLPLALKVLGSFFHGREADVWESALDRLGKTPNNEIFRTLKLSFDVLEESEKKIFLDIACLFKGQEVDYVTRVLDSFGFHPVIGIRVLIEKSLITVSNNRLDMHDLIHEMGWKIVHESAPHSRLWKQEQLHDFIKKCRKFESIECIACPPEFNIDPCRGFRDDVFEKMKNLRLLHISEKFTSSKPTILPDELRWLSWNYYPFYSVPEGKMHKLVGLEMLFGRIKHLWKGQKIMPNLKFLQLESLMWLTRLPDVSGAPNIERLNLSCCEKLVEVDESLGALKRLVYLDMSYCKNLKCLPLRIEMESLETLILKSCVSLTRFPEFSIPMVKLSHINCENCFKIQELPTSFRNVSNLSILNLTKCTSLHNIPNSICELKGLMTLSFQGCSNVQNMPNKFGNTENLCLLRKLNLKHTQIEDRDFPKDLYGLSSLEELDLSHNSKLKQLPASISHLSRLKHLDLSRCDKLQSFNGLPLGIQVLDAEDCLSLDMIEDLSEEYKWLHKIHLNGCYELLEDKNNARYLDKMLKQSFLKKWAARDGCLSVAIPGSKIPSWFKKQQNGHKIALKLPFKWQAQTIGFAICGVFSTLYSSFLPCIKFRFENGRSFDLMLQLKSIDASELELVSISYVPFSLLENLHYNDDDDDDDDDDDCEGEDWSHIIEGNLIIELTSAFHTRPVRCGAEIVYKEEVKSTQQIIQPSISSSPYYWNWNLTRDRRSPNAIVCKSCCKYNR